MSKIEEKKQPKKIRWVKVIVTGVITFFILAYILGEYSHNYFHGVTEPRALCRSHLYILGQIIMVYKQEHQNQLPDASKWCDLLIENNKELTKEDRTFKCSKDKTGPCSYAMNPNCEPNSPGDVVLLFESKGGWNQSGGPELLNIDNHEGKGCNILFNDGDVKFVETKNLKDLKWN